LEEGALDGAGPPEPDQVEGLSHPDPGHREWRDVVRVGQRCTQGSDALDHLRVAMGGDLGQQAATAVSDQGDPLAKPAVEVNQAKKDDLQHCL